MDWEVDNTDIGQNYFAFCKSASEDDTQFVGFKTHPNYTPILSHVSRVQGQKYLEKIDHDLLEYKSINDVHGGPSLHLYDSHYIDPTSLRYIKFVSDIRKFLGTDLGDVIEIGGGYGGLCLFIKTILKVNSYSILDNEFVILLVKKYLKLHNIELNVDRFKTYDTVISTFAWDELGFDLREEYLHLMEKSNRGYLVAKNQKIEEHEWPEDVIRIPDTVIENYSIIYWNRN